MAVDGVALESKLVMMQANEGERRQREAAQQQACAPQQQQSQQPQQLQGPPPQARAQPCGPPTAPAQAGASQPRADVVAASDLNSAQGKRWDEFRASACRGAAVPAPGQQGADAQPHDLYRTLGSRTGAAPAAAAAIATLAPGTAATASGPAPAAAKTGLAQTLDANPRIKTNQDLINHYYRKGGGTWEGASKLANADGVTLNQLIRDRQGASGFTRPTPAAPAAPGPSAPAGTTPTTGAAAASGATGATGAAGPRSPSTTSEQQGIKRSIRPFRDVDQKKLEAALPTNAKHLASSFIDAGRKNNIDPVALVAIAKHETGNFTSSAFKNKNNAMGISDARGPTMQKSAEQSIEKMAYSLAKPDGHYKGKNTLGEVANTYAPVGAKNDPTGLNSGWAKGVAGFADDLARQVRPGTSAAAAGATAPRGAESAPGLGGVGQTRGAAPAAGSINDRVAAATRQYMDTSTAAGPDGGNLACAWAVNNILKNAGLSKVGANTNLVRSVEADLQAGRGTQVDAQQARAGDIVIWPSPRSHIGIMSDHGKVANNSSSRAQFSKLTTLPPGARVYRLNS